MENAARMSKKMDTKTSLTAAAGIGSVLFGLTRKSLPGKLFGIVPGVYLGAQAYASTQGESVGSMITRARSSTVEQSVHIDRTPSEVYEFVRDFKNMSSFMTHTHDVREDDEGRIHWVVKAMNGLKLEYDGMVVDEQPGQVLTYRSAPEEPFEETGTILFEPVGDGATRLTMRVAWTFPGGLAGAAMTKAMEPMSEALLAEELGNLKQALEAQKSPVGAMM